MTRIAHKLDVLRAEQLSLKEEIEANEELGAGVRDVVHRTAKVLQYSARSADCFRLGCVIPRRVLATLCTKIENVFND